MATKRTLFHTNQTSENNFQVDVANVRGIRKNLSPVAKHLREAGPDLLFLTETQIGPEKKDSKNASKLDLSGYSLEPKFKRHAGVCLYIRDTLRLNVVRLKVFENAKFSVMWIRVDLNGHRCIYACIYRSPNQIHDEYTEFFEYMKTAALNVSKKYPKYQLVLLGDFNVHHKEWLGLNNSRTTNSQGKQAYELSKSLGLKQLVKYPTRQASLLDLFMTSDSSGYKVHVLSPLGTSDHWLVSSVVPIKHSPVETVCELDSSIPSKKLCRIGSG